MSNKYFACHYGNVNNLGWLQAKGFNEVGYVIHYGASIPSPVPIHNAGMIATLNIFNDGSTPPTQMFIDGAQFEGYFSAIKNAGYDLIAGEGCTTSVINSVQKYLPYVNYGGDQANNMYTTPWGHQNTGKGHLDYIETYTAGNCVSNVGGVQGCISAAKAAGAKHLGILIGDWCLGVNPWTYINIVDAMGCDTICFWGGYGPENPGVVSSKIQSLADILIGHYGAVKWSGGSPSPSPSPSPTPSPSPGPSTESPGYTASGSTIDITKYLTKKHDGQPTPGFHKVEVSLDKGTSKITASVRVREYQPGLE